MNKQEIENAIETIQDIHDVAERRQRVKKYFDIIETVKYTHRIEIEIEESQDEAFEELAEGIANGMDHGSYDSKEEILSEFISAYSKDSVEFTEDGSPEVRFEVY